MNCKLSSWFQLILFLVAVPVALRRQARDELFKDSGDESREQGVYKTDLIKIRFPAKRNVLFWHKKKDVP